MVWGWARLDLPSATAAVGREHKRWRVVAAAVVEGGRGADGLVPLDTGLHCRTERVVSVARGCSPPCFPTSATIWKFV